MSKEAPAGREMPKIRQRLKGRAKTKMTLMNAKSQRRDAMLEALAHPENPNYEIRIAYLNRLVIKSQEFKEVSGFRLYDYLIQDNGFQPDAYRVSKPKARPNHAFWMIFKKDFSGGSS